MRKYLSGAASAAIVGAATLLSSAATPAEAQVPGGSYLQSCRSVRTQGDAITATCRRSDGSWARTTMHDADRCRGGVANIDGRLACNHGQIVGSSEPSRWERNRWDRDHRWNRQGDHGWTGYGSSQAPQYAPRQFYGEQHWYGR